MKSFITTTIKILILYNLTNNSSLRKMMITFYLL